MKAQQVKKKSNAKRNKKDDNKAKIVNRMNA